VTGRRTIEREHNASEGMEPSEQGFVILPSDVSVDPSRRIHGSLASLKGSLLHANRDFSVPVCRFQTDVTKPTADHVDVYPGFEKMNRGRMPEEMGADPSGVRAALIESIAEPPHDLIDPETRQRLAWTRHKDGAIGGRTFRLLIEKHLQLSRGFEP
jgi:hypothetical protein